MKTINWKHVLYIVLSVAVLTAIANWFVSDRVFGVKFVVNSLSLSVTIITVLSVLFCSRLWKMRIFRGWLVKVPDLNGLWIGNLESDWVDPNTSLGIAAIPTELRIKQSLFKVSCVMKTGEMRSDSISAEVNIDPDNQNYQLVYVYMSTPKQNRQADSPIHYGTAMLSFDENFDVAKMSGNYWTGRKTGGYISVEKQEESREL